MCFDRHPYHPFYPSSRDEFRVNSQIADAIADDILDDISPHYVYYDIEIIEELDSDTLRREVKNSTEEGQDHLIKIIEGYDSYFFNNVIIRKSLYVFSFFEQGIITTWRKEKIKRIIFLIFS